MTQLKIFEKLSMQSINSLLNTGYYNFLLIFTLLATTSFAQPNCDDYNVNRNAYFGDLHVHTSLSADAVGYDVIMGPDDAYRYAFGGVANLPPLDLNDKPTRQYQNPRPLDFMAVTDHAELMGGVKVCTDPNNSGYTSDFCKDMRDSTSHSWSQIKTIVSPFPSRDKEACGDDLSRCKIGRGGKKHRPKLGILRAHLCRLMALFA